ncbi:MAG TPA: hypothetical protein VKR61_21865 [Bryobacteraceae bacterium]|nr:hypothetical protein [Bryobacteraceae bacterium]
MCHKGTVSPWRYLLGASLAAGILTAQTVPLEWRRVGSPSLEVGLASPATGPVRSVWYSADGSRLFARTASGRVFQTDDFESWTPARTVGPPDIPAPAVDRAPEPDAKLTSSATAPGRVYALGTQLYRSDDGGRSWSNLTAFHNQSVIGPGQRSLAVSPSDGDQVTVANDFGVWRSMDGGQSWSGLNQYLPNLPAARILATPAESHGARILVRDVGAVELAPGAEAWRPVSDPLIQDEDRALSSASIALGTSITAVAVSRQTIYAGSADGRIWVSQDSGRSWSPSPRTGANGPIERFFADPNEPRMALAAVGGSGAHVLRTTNSGAFWDDLTSNLPDSPAHGITAERAAGAVYVATGQGVFFATADLENAGLSAVTWTPISTQLPGAPATDLKLDANGYQLYVALEGYGVYATAAPHRLRTLRLLNAADFSARAAAPGSLISVVGGRVNAANAGALNFPVLAATDTESQIQVPFEAAPSSLSLALQTGRGRFTLGLPVQAVSPAIFVNRDGSPMILDGDSGLMLDGRSTPHSGSRLQILTTGLGRVHPDWPTGVAAPLDSPPAVTATVKAYLDREPVQVTRAALAPGYIGFYLIEVQLPAVVNAGPAELYITADGQESNRVQVVLQP